MSFSTFLSSHYGKGDMEWKKKKVAINTIYNYELWLGHEL